MTGPLFVLHVDDDGDIRTIVQMSLALDQSIQTTSAETAEEAITLVRGGMRPDLALLDIRLPGIDGPRLHDALQDVLPGGVPVIFLSAGREAAAPGAVGMIAKPFDPLTLAPRIRALLAERISGSPPGNATGTTPRSRTCRSA